MQRQTVCNVRFALSPFCTEKHHVTIFAFYEHEKVLEDFLGGNGVAGKRLVIYNDILFEIFK